MFRPLHYVFRISNRNEINDFYINLLEMKVLRHEEFNDGCKASCNGRYDGRWSKTMIGYGDEAKNFVIELTYNYGIGSYQKSNDLKYLMIDSSHIYDKVKHHWKNYEMLNDDTISLLTLDGYELRIQKKTNIDVNLSGLCLSCGNNLETTKLFYKNIFKPQSIIEKSKEIVEISHISKVPLNFRLILESSEKIVKTSASGRVAFSYTGNMQEIQSYLENSGCKILTNLVSLDTPGKASVEVIILLDPNQHEICIVGDQGFRELSQVDPNAINLLQEAMSLDKSQ